MNPTAGWNGRSHRGGGLALGFTLGAVVAGCSAVPAVPLWQGTAAARQGHTGGGEGAAMSLRDPLRGQSDVSSSIAPDGRRLLFAGSGSGLRDLYILDLQERRVTRLADTPEYEQDPAISPDGKLVAYAAAADVRSPRGIVIRSVDGKEPRQLTRGEHVYDVAPSFSPDGKQVVFARAHRNRDYSMGGRTWDEWDVYVVNSDGTHLRRITSERYFLQFAPRFSSDGMTITFSAGLPTGTAQDVVMVENRPGAKPVPVTQDGRSYWPHFSQDGRLLTFVADPEGKYVYEVYTARADGSAARRVTNTGSYNIKPAFTPDGRHILFLSDRQREGRYDLWQVGLDGSGAHRVADSTIFDDPLHWKSAAAR